MNADKNTAPGVASTESGKDELSISSVDKTGEIVKTFAGSADELAATIGLLIRSMKQAKISPAQVVETLELALRPEKGGMG